MPWDLDRQGAVRYHDAMINHMLMLIFSLLTLLGGGASTNAPTNALTDPPPMMRPTHDAPPPFADHCVEDEVKVVIDDTFTICIHREGDGVRLLPN